MSEALSLMSSHEDPTTDQDPGHGELEGALSCEAVLSLRPSSEASLHGDDVWMAARPEIGLFAAIPPTKAMNARL
jgi:hypothetical protein